MKIFDKIRFKKRSGMIRRETVCDFWYLYINDVKYQKYYIEKDSLIPYYLIIFVSKKGRSTSVQVGDNLIFRDLHSVKKALLDLIYFHQNAD